MKRAAKIFSALVLVASLQACTTLGPDYAEPEVDWLQDWETDLYGQAQPDAASESDLTFWWEAFNDPILNLYGALHRKGFAHSVECWNDEDELVGGLYGVALGGAFFGESMFSRATDSSKVALVHLVARLKIGGFQLLDAQFHNPHLDQFGLEEITRDAFRTRLWRALRINADFYSAGSRGSSTAGSTSLQAITQIS